MLHGANLEKNERQMILAATQKLTVEGMRSTLKRVFSDTMARTEPSPSNFKEEPTFKTDHCDDCGEDSAVL